MFLPAAWNQDGRHNLRALRSKERTPGSSLEEPLHSLRDRRLVSLVVAMREWRSKEKKKKKDGERGRENAGDKGANSPLKCE